MDRHLITLAAVAIASALGFGAMAETPEHDWYFGFSGGTHASKLIYSNLDTDFFPDNEWTYSPVASIFLRKSFGAERHWVLRPEVSLLNRGGMIHNIYNTGDFYELNNLRDIKYRLKPRYVDVRVPVMYQFGHNGSRIRPYLFVAPVLGLCNGGKISLEREFASADYASAIDRQSIEMDVTEANMNAIYFAAAAGAGLDWYFNVGRHRCFLGLEANYEYGITDTYGKDNDALHKIALNPSGSVVEGTRRMQGIEVKLSVGIPFSIFTRGEEVCDDYEDDYDDSSSDVFNNPPEPAAPTPQLERPCYSLEEINTKIARGERVDGLIICAIDGIINFEFGKSDINPESYPYLNQLASTLKRINTHVLIKGHTDNIGEEEFNMRLSRDRAIAVYNYLINQGVSPSKLSYAFFGMSQPISDNSTEQGRQLNRRVEFEILK